MKITSGPSCRPAARLDRLRDGLLVFFVGIILFCVAAAVNFLAHLACGRGASGMLASGTTISEFASNASRRVVGQWRGAGGASCEDHLAFCGELFGFARRLKIGLKTRFLNSQKNIADAAQKRARRPERRRKPDHTTLLVLVRQVHLDRHPRPSTIVPQLQSMTVRDRPAALAARPEGHDRRVLVVLQFNY